MARKVFYSFKYDQDYWRTQQIRMIGVIEGNQPCAKNDWENVRLGGDPAVYRWIDKQLIGRTCTIVLVGQETSSSKFVNYEIRKSWELGLGVVGIRIHNLKDQDEKQSRMGKNPFLGQMVDGRLFSSYIKLHDPHFSHSQAVYNYIATNISRWVEVAIYMRRTV